MTFLARSLLLLLVWLSLSCSEKAGQPEAASTSRPASGPLLVYAVNEPLAWMARQIGGDRVDVRMPVPEGVDPAFWQPTAGDILPWQRADLILLNGAGYAAWLAYAQLPQARMTDTSVGLSEQLIPMAQSLPHSHGPDGEHSHGEVAFTLWLDLRLAAAQAEAVHRALQQQLPEQEERLAENRARLLAALEELDRQMSRATENLAGRTIYYSHPVYQYFQRRYGLPGTSLHWEPDAEPSSDDWQVFEAMLQGAVRPLMIWEAEPLAVVQQRLGTLGVEVVVVAPGAGASGRDFAAITGENIQRLSALDSL